MNSNILIFIDDDPAPLTNVSAPVNLQLDTRKLVDGAHKLRIVSQDPAGVEGIREINFQVLCPAACNVDSRRQWRS